MKYTSLICWHLFCIALTGAAWTEGWLGWLWAADETNLVLLIVGGIGCGVVLSLTGLRAWCEHVAAMLPVIGLLGTMIGFALAFPQLGDPAALTGIGTALATTIAGAAGHLWLETAAKLS